MAIADALTGSPVSTISWQQAMPGMAAAGGGATPAGAAAASAPATSASTGLPSFNPANSPYQPLAFPTATPPVSPVEQRPQPRPDQLGAVTHAGAAAYLVDQGLRGIVEGHQRAEAFRNEKFNRHMVALSAIAKQEGNQFKQLYAEVGSEHPGWTQQQILQDPRVAAAKARVDANFAATQETLKNYLPSLRIDKKTGKPKANQQGNLLERMFGGGDPHDAIRAYYEAREKLGPSVMYALPTQAQLQTLHEQRQAAQTEMQAKTAQLGAVRSKSQTTSDYYDTIQKLNTTTDPAEYAKLEAKAQRDFYALNPAEDRRGAMTLVTGTLVGPDGKRQRATLMKFADGEVTYPNGSPVDPATLNTLQIGTPSQFKPRNGAIWDTRLHRYIAAQFDDNNQLIPGSENPSEALPAGLQEKFGTHQSLVQGANGQYIQMTQTTTSGPVAPSGVGAAAEGVTHSTSAVPVSATNASGHPRPTGVFRDTPAVTQAREAAASTAGMLEAAQHAAANLNPATSFQLFQLYNKANNSIGKGSIRMSNAEMQMAYSKAVGSISARLRAAAYQAGKGTIPPDVAQNMLSAIRIANQASQDTLNGLLAQQGQSSTVPAAPQPPPAAILDKTKEGQYMHGPGGVTWKKVNGKPVLVTQ